MKITSKKDRREHEFYPTPVPIALAITKLVAELVGDVKHIIEPSAGSGSFVRAAREVFPAANILAIDIRPDVRQQCLDAGADGFIAQDWPTYVREHKSSFRETTLVIGNPPFRSPVGGARGDLATAHILAALDALRPDSYLALLLRLPHLCGRNRAEKLWARGGLFALVPLAVRPKYVNNRSDACEYALYLWKSGHAGEAKLLPPLLVEEPDVVRQRRQTKAKAGEVQAA